MKNNTKNPSNLIEMPCLMADPEKYGFPKTVKTTLKYPHAHQLGILACITNDKETELVESNLNQGVDFKTVVNDPEVIKETLTQLDDNDNLRKRIMHFIPYQNPNCSMWKKSQFLFPEDKDFIVECVLVEEWQETRSFCFQVHNYNQSLFSIVENFITCDVESEELDALIDENDLFRYRSAQDASDAGYYVDYYDNIGQRFEYYYHDVDSILDRIVSMRIVETNTNKKKG